MRLGANRVSICPMMSAIFVLASLLAVALAWSDEPQDIIPGRAFGPITLGMPAVRAYAAATRFERETRCGIDLLIAHGVVIAAGSKWGGCLHLPADRVGIGGLPIVLVRAFGTPLVVRRGADEAVLLFPNGLVACVSGMQLQGGVVSYLAVQASKSTSVPQIGYLFSEDSGVHVFQVR